MIKAIKLVCFMLFLMVIPQLALAQTTAASLSGGVFNFSFGDVNVAASFTPLPTDLSVNYLGQVFGTVGTVLHGESGQMLGQLFQVFNIGILVLAGIFLIYTIFMTVLNAAHEGEFMGKKWNSAWIAIRTILGLGLLVPSPTTGYSTIQVIVMWVVIQGCGFANLAWYNALKYISQGGQVYTPPPLDTSTMVDLVGNVMLMQTCMLTAESVTKTQTQNQQNQPETLVPAGSNVSAAPLPVTQMNVQDWSPLFTIIQSGNVYKSVVKFPGNPYQNDGDQDNVCGQISFGSNASLDALKSDNKVTTLQSAIQQIILDSASVSKQIVQNNIPSANIASKTSPADFANQVSSSIVAGAADWVNITLPIRTVGPSIGDALMLGYYTSAVEEGWIMAGRYYYALGAVQRQVTSAMSVTVNIDNYPAGVSATPSTGGDQSLPGSNYLSFVNTPRFSVDDMNGLLTLQQPDKLNLLNIQTNVANYVTQARTAAQQVDQAGQVNLNIGGAGILGFLLDPIETVLLVVIAQISTAIGNPILVLQTMGYGFMTLASTLWLAGTAAIFGVGLGTSVMSSLQPAGYATEDATMAFIPIYAAFIMIFFTMGATFAFYIPLIPFIIFVFSAIGWLIAVIEAMVAAPLVALGITHPEGHDLLGKSEQAIMLLLSVFLRPVLMIIGLIAGMILSNVALRFLNSGFFGIVFDVGDFNLFAFVAVLVIYCMLIVSIVNQSFALIYVVPDRVMRWLGVNEQSSAAQEALQLSKGGFEQVSGGVEKMSGGTMEGSKELARKRLEERDRPKGTPGQATGRGGRPQ